MSEFKESKDHVENAMMLKLLANVEADPSISQRTLSQDLNIAFGLVNTYLKRCIKKGWVRAKAVSPKRYLYFVTPEGFAEKSRMISDYLANSMSFFRDAREQFEQAFEECSHYNWQNIAFVGSGDLAQIGLLVAQTYPFKISILEIGQDASNYDAAFITDITSPQEAFNQTTTMLHEKKIITLDLLHISRQLPQQEEQAHA